LNRGIFVSTLLTGHSQGWTTHLWLKSMTENSWQGVTSKKNLKNLFFSIFQVFKALQLIPQGTLFVHKNIQPEVFYE
jgi:hypothetical protein